MIVTDLVNLEAYPIQDIETPAAQVLVAKCRKDLDKFALSTLDDFVLPDALVAMRSEIDSLLSSAYRANTCGHPTHGGTTWTFQMAPPESPVHEPVWIPVIRPVQKNNIDQSAL